MEFFSEIWRRLQRKKMAQEQVSVCDGMGWSGTLVWDSGLKQPSLTECLEMLQDAQVQAALQTKKLGALNAEWRIEPGDDTEASVRAARLVKYALEQLKGSLGRVLWNAMDALAFGYSVQEINYRLCQKGEFAGSVIWQSVKAKDPRLVSLKVDEYLNLTGIGCTDPDGRELQVPMEKFAVYIYNPRFENPTGQSDLRAALMHWKAKRRLLQSWQLSLERFGAPTMKGTLPRNVSDYEREEMLRLLQRVHENSAIVIPDDAKVELLEGQPSINNSYLTAVQFHNKEIAKAIMGQTLTTDEGSRVGSLALGKIHFEVLQFYMRWLRRELAEQLVEEQLMRRLVEMNIPDAAVPKLVWAEAKKEANDEFDS